MPSEPNKSPISPGTDIAPASSGCNGEEATGDTKAKGISDLAVEPIKDESEVLKADAPPHHPLKVDTANTASPEDADLSSENSSHNATLEDVVTKMTNVEKEMDNLRAYLAGHDAYHEPLVQWPPYARYAGLHSAVAVLNKAVDEVTRNERTYSLAWTHRHLATARSVSLSTSEATIFAFKVMSKQMAEYAKEEEHPPLHSKADWNTDSKFASEVGKLLEHSTGATDSIWAAVDLLQQLHNASLKSQEELAEVIPHVEGTQGSRTNPEGGKKTAWSLSDMLPLVCMLCCVFLTLFSASYHAPTGCTLSRAMYTDLSNAYNLFHESYKVSSSLQNSQHHKLLELDQHYHEIQSALDDHDLRIDNIWEALGPPNANGTFYGPEGTETNQCECAVEGELQKLRQSLQQQVQRVEASASQMRQNMHLADIRLSGRLDKVERKVR